MSPPGAADLDGLRPRRLDPAAAEDEAAETGIDQFDRLPDSVLLLIFNLVGDVKQLGRCCLVSRRFLALAPLVDDVIVRVDCVISDESSLSPDLASRAAVAASGAADKPRGVFSHLARLILGGLARPLQALGQILSPSPAGGSAAASRKSAPSSSSLSSDAFQSHHSPTEVLKNFKEIRRLRIELPAGELRVDGGVLLNWRAAFGSTLDRCVILGASSVSSSSSSTSPAFSSLNADPSFQDTCSVDDCESIPESFYTNGSLKRRVVWTISSLIAASSRHYLLHPIVVDHKTLQSLVLTDADGQGVLTMDGLQLQELSGKPVMVSRSSQRTLLPALSMRLWYAHRLELPGGVVLSGATLLDIRPCDECAREAACNVGGSVALSDGYWISNAFEEPYRTATRILMKKKAYCLEMNSF